MNGKPQVLKLSCRKCKTHLDLSDCIPFTKVNCPVCGTKIRVPKSFDRYWLEKLCGLGGMSKVYRAIDPDLARRVAVKILNPGADEDGTFQKRFLEEARIVARLDHPGIIPIYNCGNWNNQPYLVMRYMEHGSLHQYRQSGGDLSIPHLCEWFAQIAEGLDFALSYRVVHHDVKPGNILLTSDNEAKLGDFDLADVRDEGDSLLVCDNWGSPGYVSPERLYSGCEDSRGDIFSLGVSLYEMFSMGVMPFGVNAESEELLERREKSAYIDLHRINPQLPKELCALVREMMAYQPDNRPKYPEIIAGLKRYAPPKRGERLS